MAASVDKNKFDAVLARLIKAKPQTEAETKAKATADRKAKKAQIVKSLEDIPITKRYGTWARWSPNHQYLYWAEVGDGLAWRTCLEIRGEVAIVLPESVPPLDLRSRTDA